MYLEIDDKVLLNYECDGDPRRPTLLLWNGAHCTLRQWDHVVPSLKDSFHVVRFDVRGSGQSRASIQSDYSMQTYADDVIRLLNYIGVCRCHIWSMAWGSRAAMTFCVYQSERVLSASLFDLSIGVPDVRAQREGAIAAQRKQAEQGYEAPSLPDDWNTHLDEETLALSLSAAGNIDLSKIAPKMSIPVLVATGDHDPNLKSSQEAAVIIPNAKLVELPDVGHGSILMQPDLCIEVLLNFVTHHLST